MKLQRNDLYFNGSSYPDPTAAEALARIVRQEQKDELESKKGFLIKVILFIIRESGFELLNRLELRHKASGRTWR